MAVQQWTTDRLTLWRLLQRQPAWSNRQLATATNRSIAWVKRWKQRWRTPPLDEVMAIQPREPTHQPASRWAPAVIARILSLRDELPATLGRVAGPKTIGYYLDRDPDLADYPRPQSPKTIWAILRRNQRIGDLPKRDHHPLDRPGPLDEVELDWTDVTTIPRDPDDKWQHQAEILNIVDRGTSIPLLARVRADFTMATTIDVLAAFLAEHGCPPRVRYDRDPRLVGSAGTREFPSYFARLLLCLGIEPVICPPRRPDLKPYVERFNKTIIHECVGPAHPTTIAEAQALVDSYLVFYCHERPHQGNICANRPPREVFPTLPTLPPVPAIVDPDAWLTAIDGESYTRRVAKNGKIHVAHVAYSIGRAWAGQEVTLRIAAATREFAVWSGTTQVKQVPIKGVIGAPLPYAQWVAGLAADAERLEQRLRNRTQQRKVRATRWQ